MRPTRLFLTAALMLLPAATSLRAELPPDVYDDMQKKAPVKADIFVTEVTSALPPAAVKDKTPEELAKMPYAITVQAKLVKAERGGDGIPSDAPLNITYERQHRPEGFVGPAQIPILEVGKSYTAYLTKDAATPGLFLPAAKGQSFAEVGADGTN